LAKKRFQWLIEHSTSYQIFCCWVDSLVLRNPLLRQDFDNLNKNVVARFLQTPCMTGWTEEEYILGQDTFYKVIVRLDNAQWTVSLMDIGEQDIPMLTDKLDIWLRTKIGDAFWNNTKRKINKIKVTPMSGKTSKGVTE
jgi:hypothetical protein